MLKTPALYIVATPIGNLGDMSARAIETLKSVDYIAAEDTRHSHKLLVHFAIDTPVLSLHEHNESECSEKLLEKLLKKGQTIALISDAGTPLISDPGYRLVKKVRQHNIPVIPIPGPCALITALSASGLNCEQFIFEGFLPEKKVARQKKLDALRYETRTLIFYEAPHRILDLVEDMLAIFGAQRIVVLARELTKTFETIHEGNLEELTTWLNNDKNQQRGEFVVLVEGNKESPQHSDLEIQRILKLLLDELPIKQAAALAAKITHGKKNKLYAQALALTGKNHDN
ncbi:16S rRNA (cytidine(1402)-2'-O)-methyltransferase [Rickettsiella endosymbiont of Dermanyssus gallinae]|uniref:16S rRNA (cytidine(1402)-2'-O)-methyltransferase n=1 Tax=Rickettsiella endosymbiont of Dermanyssus gallinae TaxID=2856608 RepID=UPI001C531AA5|nr:16S rRNA (cytidine(1402)-2'-O)-methyltransferase [Rickettsiella endosymbiont of Dermanyssus gallinae]